MNENVIVYFVLAKCLCAFCVKKYNKLWLRFNMQIALFKSTPKLFCSDFRLYNLFFRHNV